MVSSSFNEEDAPTNSSNGNCKEQKRVSVAWKNKIAIEKHSARQNLFKDLLRVAIAAVILVFM